MDESVGPEEETHDADVDLVNAFSIHSEQGFKALRILIDIRLKQADKQKRHQVVERLLDLLHRHYKDFRNIARRLVAEGNFPGHAVRWPGFFTSEESTTATGGERDGSIE